MDFFEGIRRCLFANGNLEEEISLQRRIGEKEILKTKLLHEKEMVEALILSYTMQNYQLEYVVEVTRNHYEVNNELYEKILKIQAQKTKMQVLVQFIEFDKIEKYNALPYLKFQQQCEQRKLLYQKMAEDMESRPCVVELRAVLKTYQEALELKKKSETILAQMRRAAELQLEEAIKKRNLSIVECIMEAKELALMRLQREEELKNPDRPKPKFEILSSVAIAPPKVIVEKAQAPEPVEKTKPDEPVFKVPQMPRQLSSELAKMMAATFDFEIFNRKKPSKTAEAPKLRSILRKPNQSDLKTKVKKRVVIISPTPSPPPTSSSAETKDSHCTPESIETNEPSLDMKTATPSTELPQVAAVEMAEQQTIEKAVNEQSQNNVEMVSVEMGPAAEFMAANTQAQERHEGRKENEAQVEAGDNLSAESLLASNPAANAPSLNLPYGTSSDSELDLDGASKKTVPSSKSAKEPELFTSAVHSPRRLSADNASLSNSSEEIKLPRSFLFLGNESTDDSSPERLKIEQPRLPMLDFDINSAEEQSSNDEFTKELNQSLRGYSNNAYDRNFL